MFSCLPTVRDARLSAFTAVATLTTPNCGLSGGEGLKKYLTLVGKILA